MIQQIQSNVINNDLPNGWQTTTLGTVSYIFDCPHSTPKWTDKWYFVIRNYNLVSWRVRFDEKRSYTDEKNYNERIRRAKPEKWDIVLSREAPIWSTGIILDNIDVCLWQRVVLIKPHDINNYFLNYFLLSPSIQNEFKIAESTWSVVSNLRIPLIEKLLIKLPSLPEQEAIVTLLLSLDNKIELFREQNKTLEKTAQTIFQEGFRKYGVDNLINANEILEFEKWIEVGSDNYFTNKNNLENPVMFYRVWDIATNGSCSSLFCEKKLLKNKYFNKHDILVSFDWTVGRVFIWGYGWYSSGMRKIFTKNKKIKNSFVYFWAKSQEVQDTINLYSEGTTIQHAGKAIPYLQIISNEEMIWNIQDVLDPFFEKILSNIEQIQSLSKTRDELLPRLMSGEVRVKF